MLHVICLHPEIETPVHASVIVVSRNLCSCVLALSCLEVCRHDCRMPTSMFTHLLPLAQSQLLCHVLSATTGFYFVSKVMVKDYARVKSEMANGQYTVAALFSTALVADIFDLAAQATIISGLAHANLGMGIAGAAALLVAADQASLATAALSFSCALGGELLALKRVMELSAGNSSE